jgi:hypothetical protein
MPSFLFVHQCHVLIVIFLFRCLFLRDRTRVRDRVDNIEDQYLSIDVLFKKKNSEDLFYFEYQQARQASDPMILKYFNSCYIVYDSNVFYR